MTVASGAESTKNGLTFLTLLGFIGVICLAGIGFFLFRRRGQLEKGVFSLIWGGADVTGSVESEPPLPHGRETRLPLS